MFAKVNAEYYWLINPFHPDFEQFSPIFKANFQVIFQFISPKHDWHIKHTFCST